MNFWFGHLAGERYALHRASLQGSARRAARADSLPDPADGASGLGVRTPRRLLDGAHPPVADCRRARGARAAEALRRGLVHPSVRQRGAHHRPARRAAALPAMAGLADQLECEHAARRARRHAELVH